MTGTRISRERRLRHKLRNFVHSVLLIGGMAAIAAVSAWTIWGGDGVVWAAIGVALALLLSPSLPPDILLSMYRTVPLDRARFPEGTAIVEELAARAGLPRPPRLHYLASPTLNAFTVGNRENAAITVTDGLLRALNRRELAGVLAHEISHVENNDLWIMNLADTLSRVTGVVSYFGMFLLIANLPLLLIGGLGVSWLLVGVLVAAPTLMSLLQLALSRAREYEADLDAAALTGDPVGLASALEKLERYQGRFWEEIVFPGRRIPEPSLLRTHPPTGERIRRLLELREPAGRPGPWSPEATALPEGMGLVGPRPRWRWPGLWY